MAVQQNKKSPSKRNMHRSNQFLSKPPLAIEPTTGEIHRRHHISDSGFYRGKKVIEVKEQIESDES
tara:strand:- start:238 stop:435 length:198 start_codon:yes stop_codon:yes gene_type:complete